MTMMLTWPQTSQHALSGHGLSSEISEPPVGVLVPGFCGPHIAFATMAGIGGVPLDKQTMLPAQMLEQPFHAHVF